MDAPLFRALLEERARRASKLLSLDKSIECLGRAAKDGRYVTYGDLAKASGVPWDKAHHKMNGAGGHLDRLLDVCYARGLPLLTAICVNKEGRNAGMLEPGALKGFIKGATRLGFAVEDPKAFLKDQQERVFAWARDPTDQNPSGNQSPV
jgi:hypothetical protein